MVEMKEFDTNEILGENLLGYMELNIEEWPGDWDNAIALFLGEASRPRMIVLHTRNENYSWFSTWYITEAEEPLPRDDRYKSIGETINSVELKHDNESVESWTALIKTNTKTIRLGVDWTDSYYPGSIWDVI